MAPRVRRWLSRHPRVVVAVLLAFAVELLPPASGVVRHRHEDGRAPHIHGGRMPGTAAVGVPPVERDAPMIASGSGLHGHEVHPMASIAGPTPPAQGPALLIAAVEPGEPLLRLALASRPSRARAPPVSVS